MERRALAAVTSIAVLALLAMPAGDSCAVGGDAPHLCCSTAPAPVQPTAAGSCCSDDASSAVGHDARKPTSRGAECNCVHAPHAPAAAVVGTPTSPLDEGSPATLPAAAAVRTEAPAWAGVRHHDPASRSAPPPLFLLDCAFLI
jgi:hypothetical protein